MRVLALVLCVVVVSADVYMHNPPGSNDRNRERNDNRNNGDRLFDSQNNGKGGYAWRGDPKIRARPDPLTYYSGSVLRVEWTNQHACGTNPNSVCDIIIQYACDCIDDNLNTAVRDPNKGCDLPGLRDGYPDSDTVSPQDNGDTNNLQYLQRQFSGQAGQNQDGTRTIPENVPNTADTAQSRSDFYTMGLNGGVEYGYHETIDIYRTCKTTTRNKGLYAADQKINPNSATGTRQNPNGARRGLECPEERDYYPYWNGAMNPWHDVAILTNNMAKCDYFQNNSPNVKAYGYCANYRKATDPNALTPIDSPTCVANGNGVWNPGAPKGGGVPDCQIAPHSRDNHLGNAINIDSAGVQEQQVQPEAAHYLWTIPPQMENKRCIVRLRYNISTDDYPASIYSLGGALQTLGIGLNSTSNCETVTTSDVITGSGADPDAGTQSGYGGNCGSLLTDTNKPLYNRPYVRIYGSTVKPLSLAINTNQAGRTFQDRSYVFDVRPAPVDGKIFNLNVRGRRGNIVQCYPAVEYDFVPANLHVTQGDLIHVQVHGSDFNEAKNANNGEGWKYSDRSNLVQYLSPGENIPAPRTKQTMFSSLTLAQKWGLLDQDLTQCKDFKNGDTNEQNSYFNCGKLNQAKNRFPADPAVGLLSVGTDVGVDAGVYYYGSTRNNNFSNRSQKAILTVEPANDGPNAGAIAGGVIGGLACVGFLGFLVYGARNPNTKAGSFYSKISSPCRRDAGGVPTSASTGGTSWQPPRPPRPAPPTSTSPPDMEYVRHGRS